MAMIWARWINVWIFVQGRPRQLLLTARVCPLALGNFRKTNGRIEGGDEERETGMDGWMEGGREGGRKGESFADKNAAEFGIT